jgi:uncharacterized membrane protein YkoI
LLDVLRRFLVITKKKFMRKAPTIVYAKHNYHIFANGGLLSQGNNRRFAMRRNLLAAMTVGLIVTASIAGSMARADDTKAVPFTGEKFAKEAKITLDEARAIALKTYDGEIVAQELEKERGGSGLRYSFDIKKGKVTHEVGVDAKTGKLLENSVEGPHHD